MVSVCIPIFNFDARQLVKGLHMQLVKLKIEGEILVTDDCSDSHFKKLTSEVQNLEFVRYEELEKNIGRSAIRNSLAEKAQYEYLIFLDCDMKLNDENFLKKYLENVSPEIVLVGGLSYQKEKPDDEFILHWKVGKEREVKSVEQRSTNPYQSFLSSNFLVPKSIFNKIKFDESLKQYGHEDTLFGLELKSLEVPIIHIENQMEHTGLEAANTFLLKAEKAIENLAFLYSENKIEPTKLIATYLKVNGLGISWLVFPLLNLVEQFFLRNVKSSNPSLRFFDLFKLSKFYQKWIKIKESKTN